MSEPLTEAGKRFVARFGRARFLADILAIEAEARATPDGLAELVREMRYHHNLAGRDVAYTAGWDDATRMLLDRLADLDAKVEETP